MEAAFTTLSTEVKNASLRIGPSWKPALSETFHSKSWQDPYCWFFALDCFFEVIPDLGDPTSRVAFAATIFRDDALKWWWQDKTSGNAEEHNFDRFKPQLCSRFLTKNAVKDARIELVELKQIMSTKAYSSVLRTLALSVTDLSPAVSLDRYLRGVKKHVMAQVQLQKPTNTEHAMQFTEIYHPLVFGFSDSKHYKKSGTDSSPNCTHLRRCHGVTPFPIFDSRRPPENP